MASTVFFLLLLPLLLLLPGLAFPQPLDQAKLLADYRAADAAYKEGKGWSESADSGTLGWGEAAYLTNYANCWLVSHDPYWLGKIEDHFSRMIANASDPDGDGFLGWQTTTYSAPVYWCLALYNRGTATAEPAFCRELNAKVGKDVTGHTYVLSFTDAANFRVLDQTAGQVTAEKQAYQPGAVISVIPGCRFKLSGAPLPGDSFMVRTVAAEPIEFAVHEGMVAYPVAVFIEAVKKDAALQERFGASADKFLAYLNRNMLQKHEQHWLEFAAGPFAPAPAAEASADLGAWRFMNLITERYPNRILPHNQYLALARAFLVLKDVPGADPLMGRRAEQMARFFRACLTEQGEAWVWHYWDYQDAGAWGASSFEDTSHGHIDIGFAVEAALRGVVFTEADMKRFTRTVLDLMWNQSTEDPKLGPNVATRGAAHSLMFADWVDLGHWDPKIYELARTVYQKHPAVASAPLLLRAESLCARP